MKITLESPSRIVMKDHNYTTFLAGAMFFIFGAVVAYFLLSNLLAIGAGALLALIGIRIIVSTVMVTIVLDKSTGRGNITLQGIMISGSRDIDLGKIKKLILRKGFITRQYIIGTSPDQSYGTGSDIDYSIRVVMDTGEELSFKLARDYTRSWNYGLVYSIVSPEEKTKKSVQKIADFLGVPMEFAGTDADEAMMKEAEEKMSKRQ